MPGILPARPEPRGGREPPRSSRLGRGCPPAALVRCAATGRCPGHSLMAFTLCTNHWYAHRMVAAVTSPDRAAGREQDPLALDRQVCFAVVVAARNIVSLYRPVLEPMGLT